MCSDSQFIQIVKNSNNIRQVCKALKILPYGGNYESIKKRISKLNIDTTHFGSKPIETPKYYIFNLSQILIQGSYYTNTSSLKKILLQHEMLQYKCSNCNRTTYNINGEEITMPLQLHHIDGDRQNNTIQNLTLLCPICHSLTTNFRGKNKKQKKYIFCSKCNKEIRKNKYGLCRQCYVSQQNDNNNQQFNSNDCCKQCGVTIKKSKSGYCRKCFYKKSLQNKNKPTKQILIKQIQEQSFVKLGQKYGVSDNTIRKWCRSYDIDISYAGSGRKKSLQGLKKGRETLSNLKKLKQTCPRCGEKKSSTSDICRICYLEVQFQKKREKYKK